MSVVLAIEDNDADFLVMLVAKNELGGEIQLIRAMDGDEAFDFLHKEGAHRNAPTPDLILLNWNLPRRSGGQILLELKQSEDLRRIPVVVFTSAEREKERALELGATDFVVKPTTLDGFLEAVRSICSRLEAA